MKEDEVLQSSVTDEPAVVAPSGPPINPFPHEPMYPCVEAPEKVSSTEPEKPSEESAK